MKIAHNHLTGLICNGNLRKSPSQTSLILIETRTQNKHIENHDRQKIDIRNSPTTILVVPERSTKVTLTTAKLTNSMHEIGT